jgi:hypothetical protein
MKGAAEIILESCTKYIDPLTFTMIDMTTDMRNKLKDLIT